LSEPLRHKQEGTVHSTSSSELSAPRTLAPAPLTQALDPDFLDGPPSQMGTDPAPVASAAHDPTLLLAALEEIQAQRAAIEWLVEADLLCLCSV
jgi:hypothetical protein